MAYCGPNRGLCRFRTVRQRTPLGGGRGAFNTWQEQRHCASVRRKGAKCVMNCDGVGIYAAELRVSELGWNSCGSRLPRCICSLLLNEDGAGGHQRGVNLLQAAWPVTLLPHSSLANVNIVQDMMGKKMRTPSTNIISSRRYFVLWSVHGTPLSLSEL